MAYFPALIGSSTMQLVYKSVEERDKAVAAFALAVLLFTFGYAVVIAVFTATNPVFALLSSIALSVFAIMIWIIANSQETTFRNVDPASPTGGDLNDGLSGNTLGFES